MSFRRAREELATWRQRLRLIECLGPGIETPWLADGIAFGFAYLGYEWLLGIGAVIFCAVIELAQLMIPGRHARLSDFFVDAAAACVGIIAGSILTRTTRRYH